MRLIFLSLILCASLIGEALAEKRIALIIGNSQYEATGWDLENPVNDAQLMARALETVGFEVHTVLNGSKSGMEEAFQAHADRLKAAGEDAVGFFFFAGHGAQHRGINYLVASDAQLRSAPDLMRQPQLDLVMDYLEYAGNQTNFIVLDACRNNPLPAGMRNAPQGLASSQRVRGTLIAYSTAPGMVAEDGSGQSNSSYSAALAALIAQPGYSVETLFRVVATRVEDMTGGVQIPWTESGLRGEADFCFAGCQLVAEDDLETAALAEVVGSDDPLMMEVFLDAYPTSQHRTFLESRMRQLEIERSAAEEIERARAGAEFLRETLGVTTLVSELVAPWTDDPQQITARLGMEARIAQKDPAFAKLEEAVFVFFDENSSELSDAAKEHLSLFATYTGGFHVEDSGPASLTIVASCSPGESDMTICQDRAFVVRDQLIENGIFEVAFKLTENWGSIRQISAGDSGLDQDAINRYAAVMLLSEDPEGEDGTSLYDVVE